MPKIDHCTLSRSVQRQDQAAATDHLGHGDGPAQGVAAHLNLPSQVDQRRVDHGRGRALHGITGLAIGVAAQQHQQPAVLQTCAAHTARYAEFGAQMVDRQSDLAVLAKYCAIDQEIAFQTGHAEHVQRGCACNLQTTTGVKTGKQLAFKAQPGHTHQSRLASDRALPATIAEQIQAALHIAQVQTDPAKAHAQTGVFNSHFPTIASD